MMEKNRFYKLAENPQLLNQETLEGLRKLTEEFPHFQAAWVLYLKNLKMTGAPEFDEVLKKAAPLLPDRRQLYHFLHKKHTFIEKDIDLGIAANSGAGFVLEKAESSVTGNSLIDKFLATSQGAIKWDKPFAANTPLNKADELVTKSLAESDELVTETLANIYLEQDNYDKALDAFRKLSLKYPEKNSYFATRIEEVIKRKNI